MDGKADQCVLKYSKIEEMSGAVLDSVTTYDNVLFIFRNKKKLF